MSHNSGLERRIDEAITAWGLVVPKKKMFGGLGYFLNGNLAFGIHKDELIVRTSEEQGNELLKRPGMRNFAMGARTSMKNWYLAGGEAIDTDEKLAALLELSRDFTLSLPPKS